MRVRRLPELKRAQAKLLEEFRAGQATDATEPRAASEAADPFVIGIGRVSSIVSPDPQLGDHLVVAKQQAQGQPPFFGDDATPLRVHYPSPGKQVTDYAVNEFVLSCRVDGVSIALKIA